MQLLIWAALLGVTFAMPNGVFVVWGQVTPSAQALSAGVSESFQAATTDLVDILASQGLDESMQLVSATNNYYLLQQRLLTPHL